MAQLKLCMNLNMANPAADCSLNAPPSIEVIWITLEVRHERYCTFHMFFNNTIIYFVQCALTCVLKQLSEKPRMKPVKTARYWLEVM